jgi:CheY-like chemotaxis protein
LSRSSPEVDTPRIGPATLLGEIKQRFFDLQVMMVTAYGDDERRRQVADYGAAEFLTKPVDFERLKAQLGQLPSARNLGNSPLDRMTAYPVAPIDPRVAGKGRLWGKSCHSSAVGDASIRAQAGRDQCCFDLIAHGMRGIMHVTGEPDGPPTRSVCRFAISAPGCGRCRAFSPRFTSASAPARAASSSAHYWRLRSASARGPRRSGSSTTKSRPGKARHRQNAPYQRIQTKDGYLMVGAASSVMPIGVGSFDYRPTNCLE